MIAHPGRWSRVGVALAWLLYGARRRCPRSRPKGSVAHPGGPRRPLRRRDQRGPVHAPGQHLTRGAGVLRRPRRRRGRRRAWPPWSAGMSGRLRRAPDRLRPLLRPVDARRRRPRRRRSAGGEPRSELDFPWLTDRWLRAARRRRRRRRAARRRRDALPSRSRSAFSLVTLVLAVAHGAAVRRRRRRACSSSPRSTTWIPQFGVHYALGVDGIGLSLVLLTAILTPVVHPRRRGTTRDEGRWARQRALRLDARARGAHRSASSPRPTSSCSTSLRGHADPDLLPHRRLRRRRAGPYAAVKFLLFSLVGGLLMLGSVIGLYVVSAAGGDAGVPAHRPHRQPRRVDRRRALAVPRLLHRLRDQGAAVSRCTPGCPTPPTRPRPGTAVLLVSMLDKVGTFGMIRFCLQLFPEASQWATPVVIALAVICDPLRRAAGHRPERHHAADRLHLGVATSASSCSASSC